MSDGKIKYVEYSVVHWCQPMVEPACLKHLQEVCDIIDLLHDYHASAKKLGTDHHVCFCQVFDNINLYLTRSEKYLSEIPISPREKLLKSLGSYRDPEVGIPYRRWRDHRGLLCYLTPQETIVIDPNERNISMVSI